MRAWTTRVPGVHLAVFEYGNPSAERTILLVHGYPDDHHLFDPMIAELGDSVRIVAYDTRGSGQSVPEDVEDNSIERLADDAYAVVQSIPDRTGPVHVFAHDWGSVQMWEAMSSPRARTTFASFVSVSGPSLDHLRQVARFRIIRPNRWFSVAAQLTRSWYVFAFHVPGLSSHVPALLAALGFEGKPTPTRSDQQRGIALYRRNMLRRLMFGPAPRCDVSTTVVAPTRDRMLSPDLTEGLADWIPDLRVIEVDAGHWWPHTHPKDAAAVLMSSL
ncbi:alpha/beta fold hydrolase [Actinomycetes bacterium M1A6_2h]